VNIVFWEFRGSVVENNQYRIDALRVRQKLFETYPANSQAKKLMIKKQQIQELNTLTVASNLLYPKDQAEEIIGAVKEEILKHGLLAGIGIGFSALLSVSEMYFPSATDLGTFLFFMIHGALVGFVVFQLYRAFLGIKAIHKTRKAQSALDARIKELSDKIFKDL
jgi:hypothetical protein